jgi:hypothetical protein
MRACDNPFAVHRVLRERYRLSAAEWDALTTRFEALGRRAAIVGPHGSGKTTLLEDLGERLKAAGWRIQMLRFHRGDRRLPALPPWEASDVVLCDGAEQLSCLDWQRLKFRAREAGGLIITAHHDGRLPVLRRCATSPAVLRDLTASLGVPLSNLDCRALYTRHHGNLRDALRELYDTIASTAVV